jgi:hypothetical protein
MITKNDFMSNIKDILDIGKVEKIQLSNIDILKDIFKDDNLTNLFYLEFEKNYSIENDKDMLFSKTQDFIYRLNMAVNDWLIPMHNINTTEEIKSKLIDLILEDIDLYSAVDYNDSDKELIDEFESIFPSQDINI